MNYREIMAKENMNDFAYEIKGTAAVAFFHGETIKIVVDSRESNEASLKRKPNWKLKVYNTAQKWYSITDGITAVMVGPKEPNYDLRYSVIRWANEKIYNGIKVTVLEAVSFIETRLNHHITQKKVYDFGTLVVGHDTPNGLQIYRLYIAGKKVENQHILMLASFGTGALYANHHMANDYHFNFSNEEARMFAHRILFNASFHDKSTDGNINYLEITKTGLEIKERVQALQAYSDLYSHYDEGCTLFLIYDDKKEPIVNDDLIYLFRKHGDIILAHNVDHRATQVEGFYFHRLVFVSKEEAEKAWTHVSNQSLPGGCKCSTILSQFSERLDLNNRRLCVEKASKQLLDYILFNSDQVLDINPMEPIQ